MATRPNPTAPPRQPRPKRGRPSKRGVVIPDEGHPWHHGGDKRHGPSAKMLAIIEDVDARDAAGEWLADVTNSVKASGAAQRLSAEGQMWVAQHMASFRRHLQRRKAVELDYRELRRIAEADGL